MDELFENDTRTYISITGHGGIIGGILRAIGHRAATIETGSLFPVVVSQIGVTEKVSVGSGVNGTSIDRHGGGREGANDRSSGSTFAD